MVQHAGIRGEDKRVTDVRICRLVVLIFLPVLALYIEAVERPCCVTAEALRPAPAARIGIVRRKPEPAHGVCWLRLLRVIGMYRSLCGRSMPNGGCERYSIPRPVWANTLQVYKASPKRLCLGLLMAMLWFKLFS